MSWLEGSPKRQGSKAKAAPGSSAKGLWSSSTTRTYGSKRPTSSLRGGPASYSSRSALFGSQSASALGGGAAAGVGLASTYEEEAKSPPRGLLSSALSPGFDSSPIEQVFVKRGLDLGLESPVDRTIDSAPPAPSGKAGGARRGGGKSKKPAAAAARSRKGASRTASAASRGASAGPAEDPEADAAEVMAARAPAPAPKRKVPAGRTQRRRRPQPSPSARRDRSPTRRGAGRPDSPLRPITNYTSEGDRPPRTKSKVSSSEEEEWRDDGMDFTKRASVKSRGNGSSGRRSNPKEEEWRDHGLDFTKRSSKKDSGDSGDGHAQREAEEASSKPSNPKAHGRRRRKGGNEAVRTVAGDGLFSDGSCSAHGERSHGEDVEEGDGSEQERDFEELCPAPPPLLSPGGPTSAEIKLSLDSSAEGILVGDKRRRGSGRGKGGLRVAEDTAHRSSRSRHLSPLIPVSGSLIKHGFSVEEEDDSEVDDALMDAAPEDGEGGHDDDLDDIVIDLPPPPLPSSSTLTTLAQAESQSTAAVTAPPPRSGPLKRSHDSAPALAMTTSPALGLNRRWGRDTLVVTHAEVELSQASSVENLAGRGWGDDSPPGRLSRSLSSSQATAPAAWIGAGGCAKVSRSSLRRRSRANSTSSPLPMLETSASMPTGGTGSGLADAAAGGDWTSRSFGSAAKSSCEVAPALHGGAQLSRSYRMPFWNQGGSGNSLKSGGRPISLPSDPGFGWVLRSPGAPLDDRRRSQSFAGAGGRSSLEQSKSDSNPSSGSFSSCGERRRPPGLVGAAGDEYGLSDAWMGRGLDGQQGQEPVLGTGNEDEDMAPAQTPQGSELGTSAALHRAHGLSSVARRMDRLDIRSPNVESHAAQAQMEIMANPMGDRPDHSSDTAGPPDASDGTPVRPRGISLPSHRTPVGNWNPSRERSRLSGAGGSPTECFRDYLTPRGTKLGNIVSSAFVPNGQGKGEGKLRAPETPSAVATPSAPASNSPPGVTCTRSTALGLPSPILTGLFGDAGNSHQPHQLRGSNAPAGHTPLARYSCAASGGGGAVDCSPAQAERVGSGDGGVGGGARGAAVASMGGDGSAGAAREAGRDNGPVKPRKGKKLGLEGRARTVPARCTQGSPEGGFLIRRKTFEHGSCKPSSSTGRPKAYGGEAEDEGDDDQPPTLGRVSSGSRSSSLYLSCLGDGGVVQSPGEEQDAEAGPHPMTTSMCSPLPLALKHFDTPSALGTSGGGSQGSGGGRASDVRAGLAAAESRGAESTAAPRTTMARASAGGRDSCHRSPAFHSLAATSGVSDRGNRRTSTESVGATTSCAQFETPQAETKFKWGSRPQYGDWGISQPASATSLRHLAGRLRAFVDRAMAGRGFSGGGGKDSDVLPGCGGGGGSDMSSPVMHATANTPLHGATTPLPDLSLLPPTLSSAMATPGSSASAGGAGSLLAYNRSSLGSVSERGEGGGEGYGGVGIVTGEDGTGREKGEGEREGEDGGVGPVVEEGHGVEETEAFGEGGGDEVEEIRALWDPTAFGEGGTRRRSGSFGVGRGRRGRERLSSLLMTEAQREEQRRRQSKAKRRRVSLSIKSRRTIGFGLSSRLAGLSLLEAAEASSPGPGKVEPRSRVSPFPKAAKFTGGAISEGEEEEEDQDQDQESATPQAAPAIKANEWLYQPSPMSVEKRPWASQSKGRQREDTRGETPAKVREDLEKSLTELNNLSLSICNSEEEKEDGSPAKQASNNGASGTDSEFILGLGSTSPIRTTAATAGPTPTKTSSPSPAAAAAVDNTGASIFPEGDIAIDEICASSGDTTSAAVVAVEQAPALQQVEGALEALRRPGVMAKALRMLSVDELLGDVPLVCGAWRKAAVYAFAEVASDMSAGDKGAAGAAASAATTVASGRAPRGRREKAAAAAAAAAAATAAAAAERGSSRTVWSEEKLLETFPWGGFLSEGACKQVHKVWNAASGQMEALSVMDRKELEGDEEVVSREVRVSILASSLVQRRISPNFVQTYGLFRSATPLPDQVFGTSEEKYPCGRSPGMIRHQPRVPIPSVAGVSSQGRSGRSKRSPSDSSGSLRYQYIGMELCEHGDAEVFIRAQHDRLLPTVEAQGFLFQMAFALYAGRAELSLRHFDVKLLNFFVSDASRLLTAGGSEGVPGAEGGGDVTLRYGVGTDVVELCLPQDRAYLVKLADFGTADVDPLTVGNPVEACHFSTLENTPIEQLCCGNEAQQGYASDTFALALAAFHLFTGEAPYEEIMEEVECPDELYDALVKAWDQNPQYVDVCDIIINEPCDDQGEEQDYDLEDRQDPTLVHTFYRYLVLFGVPERKRLEEAYGPNNPVWKAVGPLLGWKPARRPRGGGRTASSLAAASKKFCRQLERDRGRFSLDRGNNSFVQRARARLQEIPGGMELLKSMASFVPGERPTMLEVLRSEVFSAFRR
ncbi:unnamed protein product, partial [Scytosiphon promiscuus]